MRTAEACPRSVRLAPGGGPATPRPDGGWADLPQVACAAARGAQRGGLPPLARRRGACRPGGLPRSRPAPASASRAGSGRARVRLGGAVGASSCVQLRARARARGGLRTRLRQQLLLYTIIPHQSCCIGAGASGVVATIGCQGDSEEGGAPNAMRRRFARGGARHVRKAPRWPTVRADAAATASAAPLASHGWELAPRRAPRHGPGETYVPRSHAPAHGGARGDFAERVEPTAGPRGAGTTGGAPRGCVRVCVCVVWCCVMRCFVLGAGSSDCGALVHFVRSSW